jgi:hypothetical protein
MVPRSIGTEQEMSELVPKLKVITKHGTYF